MDPREEVALDTPPVEVAQNKQMHQAELRRISGEEDLLGIPTRDPQAALEFCRRLAGLVAATSNVLAMPETSAQHSVPRRIPVVATRNDVVAIGMCELSVVIPVHNEEDNLPSLHARLTAVLTSVGMEYEIVFVDDGSRDASLQQLRALALEDPHIIIVELARNFGHQVAISAGLDYARGRGVIVMDADLQDPPEVLPQFIATWQAGNDVVYAIREHRKEGWLKRTAYSMFYRLLQRIASIQIPLDAGDFCIMDRRVVDLLAQMPERNRFVRGIRSWVGLTQVGLAYERHERYGGTTKYTLSRLIYLALDGLVSFSYLPLRAITILGFSVSLLSILLAIFYAIKKLTYGLSPPGFATIVVSLFFLAGIQLVTLGVIGEYIGRIFEEVKRRPLYVVRQVRRGGE